MNEMTINREALRQQLPDPVAVVREANRLGYVRGVFWNGLEVIATSDGRDWIVGPSYSMRQAKPFLQEWLKLPALDMGGQIE